MSNPISFTEIKNQNIFFENGVFELNSFLPNHEIYLAHLPPKSREKDKVETLQEHLKLVIDYFFKMCEIHQLEPIIDEMIIDFVPQDIFQRQELINFIKKEFFHVIVYHDFGKINHLFQQERMQNFDKRVPIIQHNFKHFHSGLGAYIFAIHHYFDNQFEGESQSIADFITTLFTYPILKHHSPVLLSGFDNIDFSKYAEGFIQYLQFFQKELNDKDLLDFFQEEYILQTSEKLKFLFDGDIQSAGLCQILTEPFSLYALLKLSFSLLTASDYLATSEYMNKLPIKKFGVLSNSKVNELFKNISEREWLPDRKRNYNYDTYQKIENYSFQRPTHPSNENLNLLRREMAIEVIQNIRKHKEKNLFYIEAPTGGGKTNLSMLAAVELLKANPKLNKVFYVFPFTTLITQTHKVIIETLGLSSDEVVQLHSKAGYKTKEDEDEKDAQYGKDKLNFIDNLFINYPFCLLSHIKFFDILKTNEKETNYILHRLANSVVVIDELQSYNPSHWDKVIYFIRNYAHYFNIKFILMSATLPKLGNLKIIENQVADFVYLLPNAKQDYFQNPNFSKRVQFNFELTKIKEIPLEQLAQVLIDKSKDYAVKNFGSAKPLGSIYTIIEFIFKKSASEFYKIIHPNNDFFDEIFVLSGTILEHRRRQIINFLKNPEKRKKRILLITTQVVEAGVDIDMDIGFKDKSLIDSDEQLAGRVNRNVNKEDCTLYLFQYNKEKIIYGKDKRYEATKNLNQADYENILETKDFDKLYSLVLAGIDKWNDTPLAVNFSEYRDNFKYLNFREVNQKFKLIEQDNLSVFVPLAVPTEVEGTAPNAKDKIFSDNELSFLAKAHIYPNDANKIEGAQVFDLYLDLIHNKRPDFIEQVVSMRTLQGIMSKFIFSVFSNEKVKKKFETFSDVAKNEFGYLYLAHWNNSKIYSEEFGIDDSQFNNIDNQFL